MSDDVRPRLVISRCLGFEACRYNGQMISADFVQRLAAVSDVTTVCPEVEVGLGVPRDPVRLVLVDGDKRLIQPSTGADVTDAMARYTDETADGLGEVDGFVLKGRSPSCGPVDVKMYKGLQRGAYSVRDVGLFAEGIAARFPGVPLEHEGRLRNLALREHFLTAVYTRARLRAAVATGAMKSLVAFQAQHKLLLLAYNQAAMRRMGRIVANHERRPFADVAADCAAELLVALARPARAGAMVNALEHGFGFVSDGLSERERRFFLDTLEEFRDERVPLSVPLHLLRAWALGQDRGYLLDQALFTPFPPRLIDREDTGRGRTL